jgi:hypothetical protein
MREQITTKIASLVEFSPIEIEHYDNDSCLFYKNNHDLIYLYIPWKMLADDRAEFKIRNYAACYERRVESRFIISEQGFQQIATQFSNIIRNPVRSVIKYATSFDCEYLEWQLKNANSPDRYKEILSNIVFSNYSQAKPSEIIHQHIPIFIGIGQQYGIQSDKLFELVLRIRDNTKAATQLR